MPRLVNARKTSWLAGVMVVLVSMGSGCSRNGPTADAGQAEEALRVVLDAWKAGGTPAELGKRSPAIHVNDLDWRDGFRLVSYKPSSQGRLAGFDMNYAVTLELKSPKGKSVKKTAVYTITTRPECLVLRQEG